ncbi:MAG: hydroxymethylbilane synthase [Deltaproteobacteria bacterium]|nr:hydroxymethylbilane synthase [Deltaproteobacteria bacterium]
MARPTNKSKTLVVGARGSPLSVAQTKLVIASLKRLRPDLNIILKTIKTSGDSPASILGPGQGDKGLFVREIEEALLNSQIDLAVHSAKDLPFQLPQGLTLGPAPERGNAFDLLVSRDNHTLKTLPKGSKVGTSSPRRQALLLNFRRDLTIVPIRGNVATRLDKIGQIADAIILAAAAVSRLEGLNCAQSYQIPPEIMLPAPGQGQLALEIRADDQQLLSYLAPLNHHLSSLAMTAERAFMGRLGAGCHAPAAAWARDEGHELIIDAIASDPQGVQVLRCQKACPLSSGLTGAGDLGNMAADYLLDCGASVLCQGQNPPPKAHKDAQ